MKRKKLRAAAALALILLLPVTSLCGCAGKDDPAQTIPPVSENASSDTGRPETEKPAEAPVQPETEDGADESISDEDALSAVRNYCLTRNPDLKDIVNEGKYPVYWEIASGDEREIVILFRSYTGSQERFYIDRTTGETCVTEFVPGITEKEERTDESFNVKDYFEGQ